jgi:hypothetical protein
MMLNIFQLIFDISAWPERARNVPLANALIADAGVLSDAGVTRAGNVETVLSKLATRFRLWCIYRAACGQIFLSCLVIVETNAWENAPCGP